MSDAIKPPVAPEKESMNTSNTLSKFLVVTGSFAAASLLFSTL